MNRFNLNNFESIDQTFVSQQNYPQNYPQRNVVNPNIPQGSRNHRKLEDIGNNIMFGNNSLQHGTYMSFQDSNVVQRKKETIPQNSYEAQFDHQMSINPSQDIRKAMISQPSIPIHSNYEGYMFEHNANYMYDANKNLGLGIPLNSNTNFDRNGEIGQRKRCAGTVQQNIQGDPSNAYFFNNFETLNKIAEKEESINRFMDRNPVNTRRDEIEKERLIDKKQFMTSQGGVMSNFNDLTPQQTRSDKNKSFQNNYVPNGRTMAIPRNMV